MRDPSFRGFFTGLNAVPGDTLEEKLEYLEEQNRREQQGATWWQQFKSGAWGTGAQIAAIKEMLRTGGSTTYERWREQCSQEERERREYEEHQRRLVELGRERQVLERQQEIDRLKPKQPSDPRAEGTARAQQTVAAEARRLAEVEALRAEQAKWLAGKDPNSPEAKDIVTLFARRIEEVMRR